MSTIHPEYLGCYTPERDEVLRALSDGLFRSEYYATTYMPTMRPANELRDVAIVAVYLTSVSSYEDKEVRTTALAGFNGEQLSDIDTLLADYDDLVTPSLSHVSAVTGHIDLVSEDDFNEDELRQTFIDVAVAQRTLLLASFTMARIIEDGAMISMLKFPVDPSEQLTFMVREGILAENKVINGGVNQGEKLGNLAVNDITRGIAHMSDEAVNLVGSVAASCFLPDTAALRGAFSGAYEDPNSQ